MSHLTTMLAAAAFLTSTANAANTSTATAEELIGKQTPAFTSDRLTPEALWAMGRIGEVGIAPKGNIIAYGVTYYSVKQNKSCTRLHTLDLATGASRCLTEGKNSERSAAFIDGGRKIAFLSSASGSSQLWVMNADGTERRQISHTDSDIAGFLFSPDEKKVILVMEVPMNHSIEKKEEDLPLSTGMVINDLMYKHWDTYVTSVPHPFLADFDGQSVTVKGDLLKDEPFECPMMPFGGMEQLAWSPDSKTIAYTCRKKVGKAYAISTDSDIFLHDVETGKVRNICKPEGFDAPEPEHADVSLREQTPNRKAMPTYTQAMTKTRNSHRTENSSPGSAWSVTDTKATVSASASMTSPQDNAPTSPKASKAESTSSAGHLTPVTSISSGCGTARRKSMSPT